MIVIGMPYAYYLQALCSSRNRMFHFPPHSLDLAQVVHAKTLPMSNNPPCKCSDGRIEKIKDPLAEGKAQLLAIVLGARAAWY